MEQVRARIDRTGDWDQGPICQGQFLPCTNCGAPKKQQKGGLCLDCRRVLGLMNAPILESEDT